jgi:hypothetical protein
MIPAVGSSVRVTTRFRNYYYKTADQQPWNEQVYEGTVVPNERWDSSDSFCVTGDRIMPIRNISVRNVVKLEVLKGSAKAAASGIRAFRVKSTKHTYLVTLNGTKLSCTCVGFQYHRNCRHAKAVAAKIK